MLDYHKSMIRFYINTSLFPLISTASFSVWIEWALLAFHQNHSRKSRKFWLMTFLRFQSVYIEFNHVPQIIFLNIYRGIFVIVHVYFLKIIQYLRHITCIKLVQLKTNNAFCARKHYKSKGLLVVSKTRNKC